MFEFSTKEVAAWMYGEIERNGFLPHSRAVAHIQEEFGAHFICASDKGNPAIDAKVREAFEQMSGTDVVWEDSSCHWCQREQHHVPGRLQR